MGALTGAEEKEDTPPCLPKCKDDAENKEDKQSYLPKCDDDDDDAENEGDTQPCDTPRRTHHHFSVLDYLIIEGSLLAFAGTPALYALYAATQRELYYARRGPLPIITDMFGDWPLPSSVATGLGLTYLFTGMLGRSAAARSSASLLSRLCVMGMVAIWLVLPTSHLYPAGNQCESWIHYGATLVLMYASIRALHLVACACHLRLQHPGCEEDFCGLLCAVGAKVCVRLAVGGIVGSTVFGGMTALNGRGPSSPTWLWTALAASELVVLVFGGTGYFLVIYADFSTLG